MASSDYRPLDDVTLEGVKAHLASIERWFFGALNRRFFKIKVPLRRLTLVFADVDKNARHFLITIYDKNEVEIASYRIPTIAGPSQQLNAIFARLFQNAFKSITVIALNRPNNMLKKLLLATAETASPSLPLRVHRFQFSSNYFLTSSSYFHPSELHLEQMATWIEQIAPFIRHLQIKQCDLKDSEAPHFFSGLTRQQEMLTALSHCHQLRSVDLLGRHDEYRVAGDLLLKVLFTLPNFNALRSVGTYEVNSGVLLPVPLAKRSLSVNYFSLGDLMTLHDEPLLEQFLGKIDHLIFYFPLEFELNNDNMAHLTVAISAMRTLPTALPLVTVHFFFMADDFDRDDDELVEDLDDLDFNDADGQDVDQNDLDNWQPASLIQWLKLAAGLGNDHPASITLFCPPPLPTVEQYAAIQEAIEQENIAGLLPLPAHSEQEMLFTFTNGAQVRLALEEEVAVA